MITRCSNTGCRSKDQALTCSRLLPLTYCSICGTFGLDISELHEPPQLYMALRAVYDAAGPEMVLRRQTAAMLASMCHDDQRPLLLLYCQLCNLSQLEKLKTDLKSKQRVWDRALVDHWVENINKHIPYDPAVTRYLVRALAYAYYQIEALEGYGGNGGEHKKKAEALSIKKLTARPTSVTVGDPVVIEWEATGYTALILTEVYEGLPPKQTEVTSAPMPRHILTPASDCTVILEAKRDDYNKASVSVKIAVKPRRYNNRGFRC